MNKPVYSQIGMLIAQFFYGMGLNVIGEPESNTATLLKVTAYILIALHILTGIGLLVRGTTFWRQTKRDGDASRERGARLGLISVSLAVLFGILTVSAPGGELWSFLMAAAFMGAFVSYGRMLVGSSQPA